MAEIDVAVIGAGVTGLAAALSMAADGRSVCVIERHPRPGLDTSTHNSGVIHGGIYYPAGTLKSRLCIEGRPLLYEFCNRHRVPFQRCGKLIVAKAKSEIARLEALYKRGGDNGVDGLLLVDRAFITKREPNIRAEAAIFSPRRHLPARNEAGRRRRQPWRRRAPHRSGNHSRRHDRQRRRLVRGRCVADGGR